MAAIRNNIISDANARDKYIQGVKLLKNDFLRTGWPNTYDIFVIWHYNAMMTLTPPSSTSGRNAAHSGPAFLPWHRWMLVLLEYHLQRVLNDPDFGLPYWDWSADGELSPDQQLTAQIWADNCMGGLRFSSHDRTFCRRVMAGKYRTGICSRLFLTYLNPYE
jgi:tyrosinase